MEFHKKIAELKEQGFFQDLQIERGIEKESLRINKQGFISEKSHPKSLGSSFTNPSITTDFAEALVEIVTPVFNDIESLYDYLLKLHIFISNNLDDEEMLWPYSMPPRIEDESKINIATYSDSNMGKLKHIYRKGLTVRYGKTMQCVSGIHYNFSLSESSIEELIGPHSQKEVDKLYLGLIRNFKRVFWFVLSEFGNSPIVDKSFVAGRKNDLNFLNESDLYHKDATSLRMSEIGYQSKAQKNLNIKYNNLDNFLEEVRQAIINPYPEFASLGLKDSNDEYHQISNGILQIENELYDCIRPKRAGDSGKRPYQLLKDEGIKYVEVRGIDLSPDEVTGISKNQMRIIDLILMHCLINSSPEMNNKEKAIIESNDAQTIKNGRNLNTKIIYKDSECPLQEARTNLINELRFIAEAMNDKRYIEAVKEITNKTNIFNADLTFHETGIAKAKENFQKLSSYKDIDLQIFEKEAEESLQKFDKIQKEAVGDIDSFMHSYNKQI